MKVSILIRTKNEEAAIAKTLNIINSQTLQPYDIIVVDSGSTDQTVEIVRQWKNINLIQIKSEDFIYGKSLNIGFEAAKGDVVISLSAHAFPKDTEWLEMLVKPFNDPNVAATYGRQLPHLDAWPPVQRDYLSYYGDSIRVQNDAKDPANFCFSNSNSAVRRSIWETQPFHETISYAEDQEWAANVLRLGYKIIYEPQATVYHSHNESFSKVFLRSYNEHRAYKELYGGEKNLINDAIAWCYLVIADIKFILKNKSHFEWLVLSPVYRFFYILGQVRAFYSI